MFSSGSHHATLSGRLCVTGDITPFGWLGFCFGLGFEGQDKGEACEPLCQPFGECCACHCEVSRDAVCIVSVCCYRPNRLWAKWHVRACDVGCSSLFADVMPRQNCELNHVCFFVDDGFVETCIIVLWRDDWKNESPVGGVFVLLVRVCRVVLVHE